MKRILVVDDEANLCDVLAMLLENDGYEVAAATNGRKAIETLENGAVPDLIISDLKMPEKDGMALLDHLKQTGRDIPLVMITAYGSIENAVEAMKQGAADFITKPFNKDVIRHVVHKILKSEDLKKENQLLRESCRDQGIVYRSAAMQEIMETVEKVALAPSAVLLLGESGTGKEVIARALHALAAERGKSDFSVPFVSINCPAVPDTLIESELFGYRKGAFTGAFQNFSGKISLANNGILFLDEIAEIPVKTQAKLLRFMEDRTFEPLGSTSRIRVEARIVCATNKDLAGMVRQGQFREDLYYRINTITIRIPPLRERTEDILPLAEHFLAQFSLSMGKMIRGISEPVRGALVSYAWPGNARELRNIIERAVVLSPSTVLQLDCLPPELKCSPVGRSPLGNAEEPTDNRLEQAERDLLAEALLKHQGNISAAARELGVTRDTIRYRIKKHGLQSG
ncbi:MAG: sigma-54 dependent transcriptional regulator [Spirochaetia bacterium]|jgi:DNA-binding NtrC family response regulator